MILFQTAIRDEFKAVARAVEQPTLHREPLDHITGKIAEQNACIVRSGLGLSRTRRDLARFIESQTANRFSAIISIGLCGALTSEHRIGDALLVSSCAIDSGSNRAGEGSRLPTQPLDLPLPSAKLVSLHNLASKSSEKRELAANTGAAICDMETGAVAEVASRLAIPWAGVRLVSDTVFEDLVPSIISLPSLIENGRWGRVLATIAARPKDIPGLVRLAIRMRRLSRQLTELTKQIAMAGKVQTH